MRRAGDPGGFATEAAPRSSCLLLLALLERDLLVDVGAAYPLRRVEIRAAVFLLELLRGPRRDHLSWLLPAFTSFATRSRTTTSMS